MFYVYLIRSIKWPDIVYAGYSTDFEQRLETHNSGGSLHTAKYRPWQLEVCLCFNDEAKAKLFEKYLKTQSGRALAKKRFL
ncbi:MAG: GIY-YIG nuclease family protein [Candidatus Dependentiae bacterium]|nr:GIY-YIG nuclease family protein [Candidatus Dependentiae bacterium]